MADVKVTLRDQQRRTLQKNMKSTLPSGKNGTISYPARAVASKVRNPA